MLLLFAASLTLQALPPVVATPRESRADSLAAQRVFAIERGFLDEWGRAWRAAEAARAREYAQISVGGTPRGGNYNPRQADLICYFRWDRPPTYVPDEAWGIDPNDRKIGSKSNERHWVCPNWLPPERFFIDSPRPPDERLGIDGALSLEQRLRIVSLRRPVIAQLDAARRTNPNSAAIIGQTVRLLVDQHEFDRALYVARECTSVPWWCHALTGFVLHRSGRIGAADSAFARSIAVIPALLSCGWTDLALILDDDTRYVYTRHQCAERDSVSDVAWWLADPLWSVPGNDRRTEHYARLMTIALHAATARDERFNWTREGGGDALAEMVIRYGWPSYTYAGYGPMSVDFGPPKPPSYGVSLLYRPKPKTPPIVTSEMRARAIGGVKTTYEYTVGRVHAIPTWSMIANPFAIENKDWNMNAPGGDGDFTLNWWPREHYAPVQPIVMFTDQQTAILRRRDESLYAYATNLGQTDLARRLGDSVDASFMVSRNPRSIVEAATRRAEAHERLTFLAPIPAGQSLVSAEVRWDAAGHRGARARFGVNVPPPLSAMSRGEVAISEPVLLVVPPDVNELPNVADSAIALMRGSTTFSAGSGAFGVYWETYGFSATDSVEITVSVQRRSGNVLGRIAVATGVISDPNSAVSVSWKEPQPGRTARTIDGPVPIQMRSVVLRMPAPAPGDYTLEVSARKPGVDAVRAKREFTLR